MRSFKHVLLGLVLLVLFSFTKNIPLTLLDKTVSDFNLKNIDGKTISLNSFTNAKGFVIIFTCNHCPFAKLYSTRLNNLNLKYKALGVPLIAINSMDTLLYEEESFELMQQKASLEKLNFPYLFDALQAVGQDFGAQHTPHAFVIWRENNNWIIKYNGAIDDNGEHPEKATPYIANAVDDLLNNKPVSKPETQSFGCRIFYRSKSNK